MEKTLDVPEDHAANAEIGEKISRAGKGGLSAELVQSRDLASPSIADSPPQPAIANMISPAARDNITPLILGVVNHEN
jgi:hypothetical protein